MAREYRVKYQKFLVVVGYSETRKVEGWRLPLPSEGYGRTRTPTFTQTIAHVLMRCHVICEVLIYFKPYDYNFEFLGAILFFTYLMFIVSPAGVMNVPNILYVPYLLLGTLSQSLMCRATYHFFLHLFFQSCSLSRITCHGFFKQCVYRR